MAFKPEKPYAPLEAIELPLLREKGIHLWLKREDLSHPFISGNKWRKLKYHLLAAQEQEKSLLVTYGGAYSNHVLATAAAGARYGFKTHALVRGESVSNFMLSLCKTFGMQLQFVSREEYKHKEILFEKYFGSNPMAFEIPEGGAGFAGELGVAELIEDLDTSMEHLQLFTSVGTGASFRGLLRGVLQHKLNWKVHGIVVLKGAEAMEDEMLDFEKARWQLHHRFHGGGYAKTNAELLGFINKFASQTGILLDQVYEAKMLLGLLTLIEEDSFEPGQNIVALHNGGLLGLSGLFG